MAVETASFGEFLIKIGDANEALECGFKSKNWKIGAEVVETQFPDCENPDGPNWPERTVKSLSFDAGGSGVTDKDTSFEQMRAWIMSAAPKNAKIYPAGANGGYFSGSFIANSFGNEATHGEKTTFDFAIQSNGKITWTPGS